MLQPAVEAAGIALDRLLNGAAPRCECSAEELFTVHKTSCADNLCVRLPRCPGAPTGYNPLRIGLAAVLKPAIEAAGIALDRLLNGAASRCECSAEELFTVHKTACADSLCVRLPRCLGMATA